MNLNSFSNIQEALLSLKDEAYKNFNKKLLPTVNEKTMIGIRVPLLRKLAKTLLAEKPNWCEDFMKQLPHRYFEENNLHAFLLEKNQDLNETLHLCNLFLPFVDNWQTCDLFSPKIFKNYPNEIEKQISVWIQSKQTYTVRFAINLFNQHYLDSSFKKEQAELIAKIDSNEYYIQMAIAWYFSTALVKQYKTVITIIESKNLPPCVQNKTIQKAIESFRLSDEKKEYLKTLKI